MEQIILIKITKFRYFYYCLIDFYHLQYYYYLLKEKIFLEKINETTFLHIITNPS